VPALFLRHLPSLPADALLAALTTTLPSSVSHPRPPPSRAGQDALASPSSRAGRLGPHFGSLQGAKQALLAPGFAGGLVLVLGAQGQLPFLLLPQP
jgi:hypothetical protein